MSNNMVVVDRISTLPDDVLCHILSFLSTKYSVRTTVLSTRWKYLFPHVPVLDLDTGIGYSYSSSSADRSRFMDFVNMILNLYNFPQLIIFRLRCHYVFSKDLENLSSLVSSPICGKIQELALDVYILDTLPFEFFSGKFLSKIKLRGNFLLRLPSSAACLLPSLKLLHLRDVTFGSSAESILSVCPVLEDLLLYGCQFEDLPIIHVSHPTLKKLWIEEFQDDHFLVLNTPNLLYFDWIDCEIVKITVKTAPKLLVRARIYTNFEFDANDGFYSKLFRFLSHARHCYLSEPLIEAFQYVPHTLPKFCNLTCLEIGFVTSCVWGLLPDLLIRSRHLKVLVFAKGFIYDKPDVTGLLYETVPACVSMRLKEIQFRDFSMKGSECKLVKYFLRKAYVLDRMIIQSSVSWKEQFKFSKKLLTFPKFSRKCRIIIDSDCAQEE